MIASIHIFPMIAFIHIFLMITSILIFLMIISMFNLILLMIASIHVFAFLLLLLDIYSITNQCFLYTCAAFNLKWITDHPQAKIPLLNKSKAPKGPMLVPFLRAAKNRCIPLCACSGTLDTTTRLDCFCLLMTQETY